MIVSKLFKKKYPDWEYHIKLLPKEIIGISLPLPIFENTIQLDTKRYGIFINKGLFLDKVSLGIYLNKLIKELW